MEDSITIPFSPTSEGFGNDCETYPSSPRVETKESLWKRIDDLLEQNSFITPKDKEDLTLDDIRNENKKVCMIQLCGKKAICKLLCNKHYRVALNSYHHYLHKKSSSPDETHDQQNNNSNNITTTKVICSVEGCSLTCKRSGLCYRHYGQKNLLHKKCSESGCRKLAISSEAIMATSSSSFCKRHYLKNNNIGCSFSGCKNKKIYNLEKCLCRNHYKQSLIHSDRTEAVT